jgi:hypothetical protein
MVVPRIHEHGYMRIMERKRGFHGAYLECSKEADDTWCYTNIDYTFAIPLGDYLQ